MVTKIPRFTFEKFPKADSTLTTQMKSVGEVMSIGRTFKESFQKALRSLETGAHGLKKIIRSARAEVFFKPTEEEIDVLRAELKTPRPDRPFYMAEAFRAGFSVDEVYELTKIDQWFLENIKELVEFENEIHEASKKGNLTEDILRRAKEDGFSDAMLASLAGKTQKDIRAMRKKFAIEPVYKCVDTCAAEFEAFTPYLYSTYERPFYNIKDKKKKAECEANPTDRKKVMILGSGPNRIGQGIEFDYCCVHASFALKEEGIESIMVNCNPETVSTDYDTSDRIYFQPLPFHDLIAYI